MSQQYAKDQSGNFSNQVKNIALVGATGSVGKYILQALIDQNKHTITTIGRGASKGLPSNVRSVQVDYDDESTIVKALQGQDALIITMSTRAPADTQTKLIAAAAKAGVKYVLPNEYCPDVTGYPDMARDIGFTHVHAPRKQIEDLQMQWFGLHHGFWYEFSLAGASNRYGFDFEKKEVVFFDDGEMKVNTTTWDLVGKAVAALFGLKVLPEDESDDTPTLSRWFNSVVYISSFLVSQRDMLDAILRVTGEPEGTWTIRKEKAEERVQKASKRLQEGGDPAAYVYVMYTRTFYPDQSGNFERRGVLANEALGLPTEDFDVATKNAVNMWQSGELAYHLRQ